MIVFGSDLWSPPEGYEPAEITHEDETVMLITRTMMDADPDCEGYERNVKGATQGSLYYQIPYRNNISQYIEVAVAVKRALESEVTA